MLHCGFFFSVNPDKILLAPKEGLRLRKLLVNLALKNQQL